MRPILELVNINKTYDDGYIAVSNFNLKINNGEFVTLLGPSGCGKTTMLKIIGGFEDPTKGKILYNGIDIKDIPIIKRPTSTVFQDYALFPNMNVEQNIQYGLKLMRKNSNNIPKNLYVKANKIYLDSQKFANKKIEDIKKNKKNLKIDINKIIKKYEKNDFLKKIIFMRKPEYLATLEYLNNQLIKQYGENFNSKITYKEKILSFIDIFVSFFNLKTNFSVSTKNMNEIEKEIYELKK